MAELSQMPMQEGRGIFLRKATGLVREVSLFDAFVMNTLGMNVAVGGVFLFLQAPADFPGGSMLLAVIIGTLVMAFTLLWVYSEFAAAMPRSGGDYIFVSRALNPFLGWLLSWSQGMWLIFFWIGFNAWFALVFAVPTALSTIGAATGQTVWAHLSSDLVAPVHFAGLTTQWWVLILGTVINVAFGALVIFGGNGYWRWQKYFFLFAGGSIIVAIIYMIFGGGHMPAAWDAFVTKTGGLKFGQIIPAAAKAGYHVPSGFSLTATLLMLPWVFFVVGYAQGSAQIGGEVKRASRNQYLAMVGGVLVNGAVLALMVILFTTDLGTKWIGSLGYLSANDPAKLGLSGGLLPGFNLIVSSLTHNVAILLFIGIGFVFWALLGTPLSELQATRYMLAWSLDRTAPKAIGDVSDRFHTPVKAIVFATITGEVALILLTTNATASLLGALLAQILAFIVVCVAGIVFPYRLPDVWQSAGGRRILGVPAVTLAGAGGLVVLVSMMLLFILNPTVNAAFAVTRRLSIEFMIGVVVVGIIWYIGAYFLNKSRGFDLRLAYREVPPE
ncbi:MAG TPA: APC family permease [Streptosporangiaceae bacterium]|nr:APC family permease [Streptosporangiaceae bacterium]